MHKIISRIFSVLKIAVQPVHDSLSAGLFEKEKAKWLYNNFECFTHFFAAGENAKCSKNYND